MCSKLQSSFWCLDVNHKKYWSRKTRCWVSPPPLSSCLSICPSTRDSLFLTLLICMIGIKDHVWLAHRFAMEIVMEIYMKGVVNYLAPHGCLPSHLPNSRTYLKSHESNSEKSQCVGSIFSFLFGNYLGHFWNQVFSPPNKHSQNIIEHVYERQDLIWWKIEFYPYKYTFWGLPCWSSGEGSTFQCREHRFDPWLGN